MQKKKFKKVVERNTFNLFFSIWFFTTLTFFAYYRLPFYAGISFSFFIISIGEYFRLRKVYYIEE